MFPVRQFEDDDDALPSIPEPYQDDDPLADNGRVGLGRLNPLKQSRAEYGEIYNGGNGYGIISLKELDAYVKDTVQAQRHQRRKEAAVKSALICSLFLIVMAAFSGSLFVYEDHNNAGSEEASLPILFKNPDGYILSQCEVELNQDRSFLELIAATQAIHDKRDCRPEVPDCDWDNPTIPAKRHDENSAVTAEWNYAFQFNIRHIQSMASPQDDDTSRHTQKSQVVQSNVDVVLIGDSIVEHWEGKDMGINEPALHRDHEVFEELFSKKGGGQIEGMAHGIGGDRCSNLLWRLQNGEMPLNFEPKVWWVLIGTEDWRVGVGSEAIVAGIVNIVIAIRQAHPTARIVINSILPRGNEKRNDNPHYAALFDINRRLACFVDSENARHQAAVMAHDRDAALLPAPLTFFNATSIFLFLDPEVGYFVNPALLPDYVHPSAQGEELWGGKIVEMVLNLTASNTPAIDNGGARPDPNNP